ncbi:uncharacterized protein Z518_09133 [Rhinocladiella mackenziei CBS 650.93]|uniref:Arginine metabolism regulation protein II n=1 Tax=Rhinocladiella mackenziei CBS 650.93 TaxID=1442369 RepID=A0A0D2FHB1_9EURO|nr:uncharacterized protein Z518_09133 [Rhinocladiella mackenziei CBS 650.93]KIX01407.1 hypothetical protein Z518_09133 [Rhinocladiella mackenziei CBS 650.93]
MSSPTTSYSPKFDLSWGGTHRTAFPLTLSNGSSENQTYLLSSPAKDGGMSFLHADGASIVGDDQTIHETCEALYTEDGLGAELSTIGQTCGQTKARQSQSPSNFSYGHPSACSLPNGSPYLPSNVRFLLSHYTGHVIDSLSPLPQIKAPWRGIHLPCALIAYGELDIVRQSCFSRVSLLYSLLSLTCYHLGSLHETTSLSFSTIDDVVPPQEKGSNAHYWKSQAQKFRGIARTAFRKSLRSIPTRSADKVKYKELFVSAMSLICAGIISGDAWDSRLFILQCEEIINKIGRTKRRFSDKALQLHRIFSYIRIIAQTTYCQTRDQYLDALDKNQDKDAITEELLEQVKNIPEQESLPHLRSIGLPSKNSQYQTMSDLGLTGPAEEEIFFDLYAIPSSLLTLISRTNQMVAELDEIGTCLPILPTALVADAAELEKDICKWKFQGTNNTNTTAIAPGPFDLEANRNSSGGIISETQNPEQVMRSNIATAIHHALLIYFFRFLRFTNPVILQHYVESVLSNLEGHRDIKAQFYPGARIGTIVWPSFIAACEALGDNLRRRALECMRHAAWTGFKNAEPAEMVAKEVWKRRDAGDVYVSWANVLRELSPGTILLLT